MSARLHAVLHVGQKLPTPTGARGITPQPKSINAGNAPRAAQLGQRATPLDKPKALARATTAPAILDTSDDTKWIEKLVSGYKEQRVEQLKTLEAARKAADACANTETEAERDFEGAVRDQALDAITKLANELKAKTVDFNKLQEVLDGNIATNGQATAALKAEKDEMAAEESRLTKLLKECNEKAAVAMESAKADSAKMVANLNAISAETEKKRMGEIADLTAENKRLVALLAKCGAEDKEKIAQMRKTSTDALKRYADLNAEVCKMLGKFKVPLVPGVDN
jgi:hypothetical protein